MPLPDPRYYYKLLAPQALGLAYALDIQSDDRVDFGFMTPIGAYSGQLWRFTPVGDGGYRLSTMFRGPAMTAGVHADEDGEVMLNRAGEVWTLEPLPDAAPLARAFSARLRLARRPEVCLDLAAGVGFAIPVMAAPSEAAGQRWLVARTNGEVA